MGTKVDVSYKRQVPAEEIQGFAAQHNLEYMECNSKNAHHVEEVFKLAANRVLSSKAIPKHTELFELIQNLSNSTLAIFPETFALRSVHSTRLEGLSLKSYFDFRLV